jgi:hypothetical protein
MGIPHFLLFRTTRLDSDGLQGFLSKHIDTSTGQYPGLKDGVKSAAQYQP